MRKKKIIKLRVIKLSKKEFKKVYKNYRHVYETYKRYIKIFKSLFGKRVIFVRKEKATEIDVKDNYIVKILHHYKNGERIFREHPFFKEELRLIRKV